MGRGFATGTPSWELQRGAGEMGVSLPFHNTAALLPPVLLLPPVGSGYLALPSAVALLLSRTSRSFRREGGHGRPR